MIEVTGTLALCAFASFRYPLPISEGWVKNLDRNRGPVEIELILSVTANPNSETTLFVNGYANCVQAGAQDPGVVPWTFGFMNLYNQVLNYAVSGITMGFSK